jgi:cell wall-associated NlpC family hydrolase
LQPRHHRRHSDSDNVATADLARHHDRSHDSDEASISQPRRHRRHSDNSDEASVSGSSRRHHTRHTFYLAEESNYSHHGHRARLAELRRERNEWRGEDIAHEEKIAKQTRALYSGDVAEAARSFEGTRYSFGGTSRSGFDCSGFTRFILGHSAGVDLPRTAMEQYYYGAKVDRGELKPGDLVFFNNTYRYGISHVGIYIGNGNFVHASDPAHGVTIDALDTPYYARHFAGARRVIADRDDSER